MVKIEGGVSILVLQELDLAKVLAMLHGECNYENTCRNSSGELKWAV